MPSLKTIRTLMIAAALAVPVAALPTAQAHAAVFISVGFAPPVLPVYAQPLCPGDGYIWTPGYWDYTDDGGYYWVPGVWVLPPDEGLLWTPAYWGWDNGAYVFYPGYWGPHVGFYGGINYGFGYFGVGFEGGYWNHGAFFYNRSVANLGVGFHGGVYAHPVAMTNHSNIAFNGGHGGVDARPTPQETQAMHEQHVAPTANQVSHQSFSAQNRSQFASANHGHPAVAAAASPAAFHANPTNPAAAARPTANAHETGQSRGEVANQNHAAGATHSAPVTRSAPATRPAHSAPAARPAARDDKH